MFNFTSLLKKSHCPEKAELTKVLFAELDLLIAAALHRDPDSGEWMCKYCSKTHKNKARISRHAEVHFPGFTQQCPHCEKVLGSRNSLRAHVSDAHTKGQYNQQF